MHSVVRKAVRASLAGVVFGFIVLSAKSAKADEDFPALLAKKLDMPCVPNCRVCHETKFTGGIGNFRILVVNGQRVPSFGQHLRSLPCGLDPYAPETLPPAIDCLRGMNPPSDVDADGVPDLEELALGQDPNAAGDAPLCDDAGPAYGCARVARNGPVDSVAAAAAAVVGLAGLSVIRRRR